MIGFCLLQFVVSLLVLFTSHRSHLVFFSCSNLKPSKLNFVFFFCFLFLPHSLWSFSSDLLQVVLINQLPLVCFLFECCSCYRSPSLSWALAYFVLSFWCDHGVWWWGGGGCVDLQHSSKFSPYSSSYVVSFAGCLLVLFLLLVVLFFLFLCYSCYWSPSSSSHVNCLLFFYWFCCCCFVLFLVLVLLLVTFFLFSCSWYWSFLFFLVLVLLLVAFFFVCVVFAIGCLFFSFILFCC